MTLDTDSRWGYRRYANLARHHPVPLDHTAGHRWKIKNCKVTVSALKQKLRSRPRYIWTQEKIQGLKFCNVKFKTWKRVSSAAGVSNYSLDTTLRDDFKLQIYKTDVDLLCTFLAIMREMKLSYVYCGWVTKSILVVLEKKFNYHYGIVYNPGHLHPRSLYSQRASVWCAVSKIVIIIIIGPYFSRRANTSIHGNIFHIFHVRRHNRHIRYVSDNTLSTYEPFWFQQDCTLFHCTWNPLKIVHRFFGSRTVTRNGDISWPLSSQPNLSLCGSTLTKKYKATYITAELKNSIFTEIRT